MGMSHGTQTETPEICSLMVTTFAPGVSLIDEEATCMRRTPVSQSTVFFLMGVALLTHRFPACLGHFFHEVILGCILYPTTGPLVLSPSWVNRNLMEIMSYCAHPDLAIGSSC